MIAIDRISKQHLGRHFIIYLLFETESRWKGSYAGRHLWRFDQSLGNRIGKSCSSSWQRPLQTFLHGHRRRQSNSSQYRRGRNWSHMLPCVCFESLNDITKFTYLKCKAKSIVKKIIFHEKI